MPTPGWAGLGDDAGGQVGPCLLVQAHGVHWSDTAPRAASWPPKGGWILAGQNRYLSVQNGGVWHAARRFHSRHHSHARLRHVAVWRHEHSELSVVVGGHLQAHAALAHVQLHQVCARRGR